MLSEGYSEYLYKIEGEDIQKKPDKLFQTKSVYLIIDKEMKIIWIWAGKYSRLFHRYIGSNWAGKLKNQKPFYNFKYELIKQSQEPPEFLSILKEIKEERADLEFPGQSRSSILIDKRGMKYQFLKEKKLSQITGSKKTKIINLISEIKEVQMQVKYTIEHLQKKINEIEQILVD